MQTGEHESLPTVARLGDHVDLRVPGQNSQHPGSDHRLVVGHQDPDPADAGCRRFHAASLRPVRRRAGGRVPQILPEAEGTPDERQDAAAVRPVGTGTANS
ncbi:hypothetical protein GCM10010195_53760 [Kitasatospora griseola]|nr:hypothetical protein GCM10010195_53760 [Kitasatospora griseola]